MANTPSTAIRVDPALIRDAAVRAGLPADARPTVVIRHALALLAGRPDPRSVAFARPGPKPRAGATA